MGKIIKDTIHANGIDIGIYTQDFENEFISLTDIARYKSDDPTAVIQNWMRNRDVIEFLGLCNLRNGFSINFDNDFINIYDRLYEAHKLLLR